MRRGTTPTHTFGTDIDLRTAEAIYITYEQGGKTVVEKTIEDMTIEEDSVAVTLTQEDTLAFEEKGGKVKIQIRAKFANGSVVASNIISTPAEEILKEGVI